jgi:hypothetical protein
MRVSPADYVVEVFGGDSQLAQLLGKTRECVRRWRLDVAKGGLGGRIPTPSQRQIMALARKFKLDITYEDIVEGRLRRGRAQGRQQGKKHPSPQARRAKKTPL